MSVAVNETDPTLALRADGLLRQFNQAGVLNAADVHTASTAARICGEGDDRVRLAMAMTVRALRSGSVCVDLRTAATDVFEAEVGEGGQRQVDVGGLPWPVPEAWTAACEQSVMVAAGAGADGGRPLRLASGLLYLERYWQQEETVRTQLEARSGTGATPADVERTRSALARLFPGQDLPPGEPDLQLRAAAVSASTAVSVIAGGPGTGKTTTVARLLALLRDRPERLRIALAAPTGKAAARLTEAVAQGRRQLEPDDAARISDLTASTLHRLLGWVPSSRGRFRHNAHNRLPFDVVVVDEMSMVSLTMMARLLEALRPDARLVLVGDPDQLSSVEAGAVLADIVGAAAADHGLSSRLAALGVEPVGAGEAAVASRVVRLTRTWRFSGAIDALANAVRVSDADEVVRVLRSGDDKVRFVEVEPDQAATAAYADLEAEVREAGRRARAAALAGDAAAALAGLDHHRLLCAHRRGPYGVSRWAIQVERWLAEAIPGYAEEGEWYAGRPLLVTTNDYELGLFNGDTGVVVQTPAGRRAAFSRGQEPALYPPVRLDTVQTVHAMTVHRAQGSQFWSVSFIVPPPESALLTRELLYTATSRATDRVQVFGTEEAIRRAVLRPANRASGLRTRLT